jgi:hypothetical protein
MSKEYTPGTEQRTELEIKADTFLDLLYRYDFVGKGAYFRKIRPDLFTDDEPLYKRSSYNVIKGRKYTWMDTPYLRLGITAEGDLFKPKNYWTFGEFTGAKIDDYLVPELWGKNIYRTATSARRGTGQYESAVFHYYDLHFEHPRHTRSAIIVDKNVKDRGPNVIIISDAVKDMMDTWRDFVIGFGYSDDQGDAFARGYAAKLSKLPILRKLEALDIQDPECMSAGLKAAGIDEDEIFKRYQARKDAIDVTE